MEWGQESSSFLWLLFCGKSSPRGPVPPSSTLVRPSAQTSPDGELISYSWLTLWLHHLPSRCQAFTLRHVAESNEPTEPGEASDGGSGWEWDWPLRAWSPMNQIHSNTPPSNMSKAPSKAESHRMTETLNEADTLCDSQWSCCRWDPPLWPGSVLCLVCCICLVSESQSLQVWRHSYSHCGWALLSFLSVH